jgi:hypothetical protein
MPFNVGDRVLVHIPSTMVIPDPEFDMVAGTVEGVPGGILYDIKLDEAMIGPDGLPYDVITDLGEDFLRPEPPGVLG